jgi:transcription elongation factor Elf1
MDQKKFTLQFPCQNCHNKIDFSIVELANNKDKLKCSHCSLVYDFKNEDLKRQLKKFVDLCYQIYESQEILSQASIGVSVGEKEVKVPFKILLSRLNSMLDLMIGDKPVTITFRIEPTKPR